MNKEKDVTKLNFSQYWNYLEKNFKQTLFKDFRKMLNNHFTINDAAIRQRKRKMKFSLAEAKGLTIAIQELTGNKDFNVNTLFPSNLENF